MPSYAEWFPLIAPPPLRDGPDGPRFFGGVGGEMDFASERLRIAALVDCPLAVVRDGGVVAVPPTDALEEIGKDRLIPRGTGPETDANYAARLALAWRLWGQDAIKGGGAGTPRGVLLALKAQGFPMGATGARVVQHNGRWAYIDGSDDLVLGTLMTCVNRTDLQGNLSTPPGWFFEGSDQHWSSFGIVFPADVVGLDNTVGNAKKALLNQEVAKWKPDYAFYRGSWVVQTGNALGWPLGRTLGTEPNLGGNTVRYIAPE